MAASGVTIKMIIDPSDGSIYYGRLTIKDFPMTDDISRSNMSHINVTIPSLFRVNMVDGGVMSDDAIIEVRVTRGGEVYNGAVKLSGKTQQPYTRPVVLTKAEEVKV